MGFLLVSCRDAKYARTHYLPPLLKSGWTGQVRLLAPGGAPPPEGLEGVSGLLLTGGLDIHPRHWDAQEPVHPTAEVDDKRDFQEIPLIREAWDRNVPVFGICRGEQILNVALGGSLIQDIPDHFRCPRDLHQHGSAEDPGELHPVQVEEGTFLASLLGPGLVPVNSRHHQAVRRVAPGLRCAAVHPGTRNHGESLVEAVESADPSRWALGVQWHPENLAERDDAAGAAARALFQAFVGRLKDAGTAPLSSRHD
jgi:putative glutamine amidotransferase